MTNGIQYLFSACREKDIGRSFLFNRKLILEIHLILLNFNVCEYTPYMVRCCEGFDGHTFLICQRTRFVLAVACSRCHSVPCDVDIVHRMFVYTHQIQRFVVDEVFNGVCMCRYELV